MTRIAVILASLAALALSACGFQPLYAERTGVASGLSGIAVSTGEGRPAYSLNLALRDSLGNWDADPRYRLETRIDMQRRAQSVTIADIATRYEILMDVDYALFDARTGERLTRGNVIGDSAFDVPSDPYGAIRAEQDSEERAARDAASLITMELARWFRENEAP